MPEKFTIIDCTLRKLHCSYERWNHIQKHKFISGSYEYILETLLFPDKILEVSTDEDVRMYFRYYDDKKLFLMVMVKYLNGKGYIITTYFTDKIK